MTDVLTEQTPPILQGPSDKEKKYDRQLRLWAASGQQALEDANLLLLSSGCGTVGVETLKNLVLPGIGKFTIADEAIVEEADLGVNFFLDENSLGKSRAECSTKLLQELNPDVSGDWFPRKPGAKLSEVFETDSIFTLIIFTYPIAPETLELVQQYSEKHRTPVVSIDSAGFYSYFHLDLPGSFPIVDTHPESTATTDLRLLSPWPELSDFATSLTANIDTLDAHEHGHIPYLILLLYYLEAWKKTHDGKIPSTYAEKTAFRKIVTAGARTDNPEGGEENYEEAVAAVLKNINVPGLSSSVREVLAHKPDENEKASSFWIITQAIGNFYDIHKELPLPGSVPDMKAQSSVYVQLQNLYKKKAREDVVEVTKIVESLDAKHIVTKEEIEIYCKNAAFVKLIPGRNDPETAGKEFATFVDAELSADPEFAISPTLVPIYLALLAARSSSKLPTSTDIIDAISKDYPVTEKDNRIVQAAQEVSRANGSELHNISALTGGMVAQEVIKIITKQYVPIENTCVFDGIFSRSQVFKT